MDQEKLKLFLEKNNITKKEVEKDIIIEKKNHFKIVFNEYDIAFYIRHEQRTVYEDEYNCTVLPYHLLKDLMISFNIGESEEYQDDWGFDEDYSSIRISFSMSCNSVSFKKGEDNEIDYFFLKLKDDEEELYYEEFCLFVSMFKKIYNEKVNKQLNKNISFE